MEEITKPIRVNPETHKELKKLAAAKGSKLTEEADKAILKHIRQEKKRLAI